MRLALCPQCSETVVVNEDGTALLSIDCPYCGYGTVWAFGEDVDILHWFTDATTAKQALDDYYRAEDEWNKKQ